MDAEQRMHVAVATCALLPSSYIPSISIDVKGNLYVAMRGKGVYSYSNNAGLGSVPELLDLEVPPEGVLFGSITPDGKRFYYVTGTAIWVEDLEPASGQGNAGQGLQRELWSMLGHMHA